MHAAGMIVGLGFPWRPLVFTAGWLCVLAIGVSVLVAAALA
jgi:hypothetical protein